MDLDDIAAMGEAKPKSDEYRAALQRAVESGDASACRRFVDHGALGRASELGQDMRKLADCADAAWPSPLPPPPACPPASRRCRRPPSLLVLAVLSDAVPLVLSRQLLMAFAQSLQQLAPEAQQSVAT